MHEQCHSADSQRLSIRRLLMISILAVAPNGLQASALDNALGIAGLLGQAASSCEGEEMVITGYRVLLDPADQGLSASEAVDRLRSDGIEDLYIMRSGAYSGYIGLGFFSRESNASSMVATLEAMGYPARSVAHRTSKPRTDCDAAESSAYPPPAAAPAPVAEPEPAPLANETVTDSVPAEPPAEETPTSSMDTAPEPAMAAESPATPPSSPPSACGPNYLVLADPADNGSDVLVLVYKLRAQGVTNLFVVTTEPNKGQVALGIYRSQAEAQARVDELTDLGFNVSSEEQPPADGC